MPVGDQRLLSVISGQSLASLARLKATSANLRGTVATFLHDPDRGREGGSGALPPAHQIKYRADELELIHATALKSSFAEQIDPSVRDEFLRLAALPPPSVGG